MDRWTDRPIDRRTDNEQTKDRRMDGLMTRMDGWMTDGQMNGADGRRTDDEELMDRRMDGRTDGWSVEWTDQREDNGWTPDGQTNDRRTDSTRRHQLFTPVRNHLHKACVVSSGSMYVR